MNHSAHLDLTLVIDIGKSNAKLLLLDDSGAVVERHSRTNASVLAPLGYPALDVHGLESWMKMTLRASAMAQRCGHVIVSTHGAAIVALTDASLAWEPVDYEFEGVFATSTSDSGKGFDAVAGDFKDTLSPCLPAGLNAARQLFWMQGAHPDDWVKTRCLLPYPQYWTWLLSGVACSEVSSLGCHTHLWNPGRASFSSVAVHQGWDKLFAPLRSAWEVVGTVQAHVAAEWGLSSACQVHVGVHDSNACLARYFDEAALADQDGDHELTIVSSGTWTVLMAPGAPTEALIAEKDMLGNVDVTGRITPTARFMGGREFAAVLNGADPHAANWESLKQLIGSQTFALPSFASQGGPFADRVGCIEKQGDRIGSSESAPLAGPERATLAAVYCAQVTAWLIQYLWFTASVGSAKVVVEGPLASNPVYMGVLQSLLPKTRCFSSVDDLEGTARGAWILAHWGHHHFHIDMSPADRIDIPGMLDYQKAWLSKVG